MCRKWSTSWPDPSLPARTGHRMPGPVVASMRGGEIAERPRTPRRRLARPATPCIRTLPGRDIARERIPEAMAMPTASSWQWRQRDIVLSPARGEGDRIGLSASDVNAGAASDQAVAPIAHNAAFSAARAGRPRGRPTREEASRLAPADVLA